MRTRSRAPWWFRLAVVIVVLLALGVGGVFAWQFWWIPRAVVASADDAAATFRQACTSPTPPATPDEASDGATIALLELPGSPVIWPIRAGVEDYNMGAGVAWYRQTSQPGDLGNMAVSGRRLVSGGPFDGILELNEGDKIVVETCDMRHTYTLVVAPRDLTVQPDDAWVLDTVPGQSGIIPTEAWLTLIANQDIKPSSDLAVGFASLTASEPIR